MLEHVAILLCYAMEWIKSYASWWSVLIHLLSLLLLLIVFENARGVSVYAWIEHQITLFHIIGSLFKEARQCVL